jgi:DNA-binding transcriptional MerR regulator
MATTGTSEDDDHEQLAAHARVHQMCQMRAAGHSLREIGAEFDVTRERARQIILDAGGPDSADAAKARQERAARQREALRARAMAAAAAEPGLTVDEAAELLGVSEYALRAALGPDARRYFLNRQRSAPVFSEGVILAHLREAARLVGEPLTVRGYEGIRTTFGGAGVAHGQPVRREYQRRWSLKQMAEAVATYLTQDGARGSFADYERWARRTEGVPSGQTIRTQFGTWSHAKAEALALLARRHGAAPQE